ncbi:Isoamylase 2, chloroplastic [Apostasia shenzhenica]|uniref:Isoamylase 2, chloroplastic n=1 Tax=Apostasia shenzhenica TaxID=1088818 RepID=A0A2I0BGF3_9ASPA|nr:Isoamylase 2, chloroplastic [Apostasia shenzhenica]
MSTSSLSCTSQPSIPENNVAKGAILAVSSLNFGSKSNILLMQQVNAHRRHRTGESFPQGSLKNAVRKPTSRVLAAAPSSQKDVQPVSDVTFNFEDQQKEYSYLFRTEFDGMVKVLVRINDMKYTVYIELQSLPKPIIDHDLILCWHTFRSDSENSSGLGSQISALSADHFMKTPLTRGSSGMHTAVLEFSFQQIPFYLSFLLQVDGAAKSEIKTERKTYFRVPVGLGSGHSLPLGISLFDDGSANFSLFSRNAESVVLCLYDGKTNEPSFEIELDPYVNRTGDIWHVLLYDLSNYTRYGYRCKGKIFWDTGSRFHARHVLLDPYAKTIGEFCPDEGGSVSLSKCLGCLRKMPKFDWNGDTHPQISMEKLVVYRLNVGRFTKEKSSGLPENVAGTFAGVTKKIQHLTSLGVNAVLLEPIFPFDKNRNPYFPYHFFSPMNEYGDVDEFNSAVNLMKEMVKTLHTNGIEVLMEVVFTHTCEGNDTKSRIISFRGIDNSSYYIVEPNGASGINSMLNCNSAAVQQIILDSLHYWLTEFHVDGFCFINSSSLLQGSNSDDLPRSPLIEAIAFDPLLTKTKIISDCWSPIDESCKDVVFPHWRRWGEMNPKFSRDVRNFLKGEGLLSEFATRLCGSGDIFLHSRGPSYSFNYVTKNFGLTLVDLVSFSGADLASELSWNCGDEGPTDKSIVLEIRLRQIRNFLFILFISLGVPVLNMGDECGYSAGGSPSYDERMPLDWSNLRTEFGRQITSFISFLTSFRDRRSDVFQRKEFLELENIAWHGSNQSPLKWEDPSCKFLAMDLKAEEDAGSSDSGNGNLFISFNASADIESANLPGLPEGQAWFRLVDTSLPYPGFFSSDFDADVCKFEGLSSYELKPHSCALFEAN